MLPNFTQFVKFFIRAIQFSPSVDSRPSSNRVNSLHNSAPVLHPNLTYAGQGGRPFSLKFDMQTQLKVYYYMTDAEQTPEAWFVTAQVWGTRLQSASTKQEFGIGKE